MNIEAHRSNLDSLCKKNEAPFFYYDLDMLEKHAKELQKLPVKLWYALKANPLSKIIKVFDEQNINFDVASIGELDQVLSQGVDPKNILHTGPAKSYSQLEYFLAQGVRIFVIESINQFKDLSDLIEKNNINVEVLLRIQLVWNDQESNVLGGGCVTPFGLSINDWKDFFDSAPDISNNMSIIGMHCFQWGNILCLDKLSQIWNTITKSLLDLSEAINVSLKIIDLGGGIGVPYNSSQKVVSINDLMSCFDNLKKEFPDIEYWLELGRYAVAESGVYVTKVIDRKSVNNINLLVTDGGAQHLVRPVLTGESFPIELLRKEFSNDTEKFQIHGPLCTSLDKAGVASLPKDIKLSDYLIFKQTGAYGFTESMPFFLCHNLPAEIIFYKGQLQTVRQSKKASSWLV
ncbi:PLP-dependent decarboxylase [Francisella philomiragia]|uniref:PLP-dependent decarboxylase n=1 Tax=Francisella philomiragia TaxID=28110 RepID=UPI001906D846|nr:PLP-dependent decarboxylase [Francisella philomiragia]MBK2256888.1 PLP-dependent decarboxylase [Francisella philomiragia]MBK2269546.1 PLP-dependent decarboxylase [Francisella philomiragia]MBK2271429.1 PLP-dependent decarboxylase [Francisella philomiragia]MBK2275209.1 PLP-dependent decarboxylase [Francisella philomiragia]MBK2294803.1 PLP-dependent decarboxylase [Francisella philomiragia]